MRKVLLFYLVFFNLFAYSQIDSINYRKKSFVVTKDSIFIDSVSINPHYFKVYKPNKAIIDTTEYKIDFAKSLLVLDHKKHPEIEIEYSQYPEFITKTYFKFDKNLIVDKPTKNRPLFSLSKLNNNRFFKPFDGLKTEGSIIRGITIGNNQDAVLNSTLDLQIAGKLSEKVTLRASITDTNIPIQENGYTQQLNEFDRVFIELFSDNWSIKAGDINLIENNTVFGNFNKKVAGISIDGKIENETNNTTFFASGALVRGKFTSYVFTTQDNNQGPYRLFGATNEQFIVIISGSETVYVNGIALKRGENNDYIIDYNTAELTFNPTFPVNANMRITVDFQYSDRKYTRFITHNGASYKTEKFKISSSFYLESDSKNQPIQQDLSDEQKLILANAGNDNSQMFAPSAVIDTYDENKILYKKEITGTDEIFVYSNNPSDELYNVKFTNVGINQGDYRLNNTIATGRIYEYVGSNLGDYNPIIQLFAPNKLQLATINSSYNPNEKTNIYGEIAFSQNDQNLFSSIDNNQNNGIATKIGWSQLLIDKKWDLKSYINFENISKNFQTIQRFRNIEFNRDWNIVDAFGNQQLINSTLTYSNEKNGEINYEFEKLNFSDSFDGTKHQIGGNLKFENLKLSFLSSKMNSESTLNENSFSRININSKYSFNRSWLGGIFNAEDNQIKEISTQNLQPFSQKFKEYEAFLGIGDSTKVFTEIGINLRQNDSLKLNKLERVNNATTYYINSQIIQTKKSKFSIYANYRTVDNIDIEDTKSLNSRVLYNQQFFNKIIHLNTVYETISGRLPQQEFTYLEVEPGQGFYTWIDYNNNNIQELNEFEIAQFQDQATYLRVALPTVNYIETDQTKFSQSLNINFQQWNNKKDFKKLLSHFQNQTFVLIDNKQERKNDKINLNPFNINSFDLLALNFNLKNNLFFNRSKQHFSTTYSYLNTRNKTSFTIDNIENNLKQHQLQFVHKFGKFWLLDLKGSVSTNNSKSQNYNSRNYDLENQSINPKLSYVYNQNKVLEVFYQYQTKNNSLGNLDSLNSQKFGVSYKTSNQKGTSFNSDFNFIINNFIGNQNTPVAYQMLEGLQVGKNFTWSLLWQQKLTTYLDLNINYLGRKSETSKTIHTGAVQLRAHF